MRPLRVFTVIVGAILISAIVQAGTSARLSKAGGGAEKEFSVTAQRFTFTPDRIEVNQGDTVRISVRSADGTHGFAIPKLKIEKTVPKGGEPVTVEFVATVPGSFEIVCSEYCGRGHSQMKALLVVSPAPR